MAAGLTSKSKGLLRRLNFQVQVQCNSRQAPEKGAVMIECHHPFGITPEKIGEFDRKQESVKIINHPVRDVEKETFWDFVNAPCGESPFTPDALASLGRNG